MPDNIITPESRVARQIKELERRHINTRMAAIAALLVEFTKLIHEIDPGRVDWLLRQRRVDLQKLRLPPGGKRLSKSKMRDLEIQEEMVLLLENALGRES